jgi:hypothetical protein
MSVIDIDPLTLDAGTFARSPVIVIKLTRSFPQFCYWPSPFRVVEW